MEGALVGGGRRLDQSYSKQFAIAVALFLLSTLVSLIAFIDYAASRDPREPSSGQFVHPIIVYSPFTLHRGNPFQGATDGLELPTFPSAIPVETGTFGWRVEAPTGSVNSVTLVFIRLQADAPLPTVKSWYDGNFPKPFSELVQQQILAGPGKESWFQAVDAQIGGDTILYRADNSVATRGVILEPSKNVGGTTIRFYYLSHAR